MRMNLFIFNELNDDEIIANLIDFLENEREESYYAAARGLIAFSSRRLTNKSIIKEYALRKALESEGLPDPNSVRDFLRQDVKIIYETLLHVDWDSLFLRRGLIPMSAIAAPPVDTGLMGYAKSIESMIEANSREALIGAILAHSEVFGTGETSAYSALRWENGGLVGITNTDDISFEDLTGLEHQKKVLIANTESFINGKPANDVLLTGSSGTGKSSSVKACLNMFKDRGLRLIELRKSDLDELTSVFGRINNPVLKYIIFIDDLSFEPDDTSYKALKVALDGQAEARGGNVLIYATSNRRSLIKETWSDREGFSDEVHRNEGLSERKSLAARFGINLSFLSPTQKEYLKIVEDMLKREGFEMSEDIRAKALAWQTRYNGFSGRSAAQFVSNFLSER